MLYLVDNTDAGKRTPNANVFAFSRDGEILWQVESLNPDSDSIFKSYYLHMGLDDKNQLWLSNLDGAWVVIDQSSGKILEHGVSDRPW